MYPTGKPHPLQMSNGNHSYFSEGEARYEGHKLMKSSISLEATVT